MESISSPLLSFPSLFSKKRLFNPPFLFGSCNMRGQIIDCSTGVEGVSITMQQPLTAVHPRYDQPIRDTSSIAVNRSCPPPPPPPPIAWASNYDEGKYQRLRQRLDEVLEDNTRLTTLLEEAQIQIKHLRAERQSLINSLSCVSNAKDKETQKNGLSSTAHCSFTPAMSIPGQQISNNPLPGPHTSCTKPSPTGPVPSYSFKPKLATASHYQNQAVARGIEESNYYWRAMAPIPVTASSHIDSGTIVSDHSEPPAAVVGPGKRRKRHHDIASKIRSVQPVPCDMNGNYVMPVQVGILTVLCLGKVMWDHNAYHNERYIWPVGYTVQREYYSMVDPTKQVIYTCWVTCGRAGPQFHVEPEDTPGSPVVASTATGAWTTVLRAVNHIRRREHSNSASGPDYFGFSHPTIAKMIQDLPGAEKCQSYIRQRFVEMKERHVRGVVKKGRGGRPSQDMLSRGQRALMASTSSTPTNQPPNDVVLRSTSASDVELSHSDSNNSGMRISVATLMNHDDENE